MKSKLKRNIYVSVLWLFKWKCLHVSLSAPNEHTPVRSPLLAVKCASKTPTRRHWPPKKKPDINARVCKQCQQREMMPFATSCYALWWILKTWAFSCRSVLMASHIMTQSCEPWVLNTQFYFGACAHYPLRGCGMLAGLKLCSRTWSRGT